MSRSANRHSSPPESPSTLKGISGLPAVGMVPLQYVLEGNRDGWFEDIRITILACAAAVRAGDLRGPRAGDRAPGRRPPRLPEPQHYTAATALNFLMGTALFAGSFLFSLFCGTILHYEAMDIGLIFLRGAGSRSRSCRWWAG